MKTLFTLLIILTGTITFAQVNQGDAIKASDFNNGSFRVGDIKQSLLNETEFQSQHGTCWVKMRGQSISGSDLASVTSNRITILPDSSGRFMRDIGGNANSVGQLQNQATAKNGLGGSANASGIHQHDFVFERDSNVAVGTPPYQYLGSSGANVLEVRSGGDRTVVNSVRPSGSHTHSLNISSSDVETRPINLSVNMYVKISNNCD
jgi:hypothetical protein